MKEKEKAFLLRTIESHSSNIPDAAGFLGTVQGVVLAESPQEVVEIIGGEYKGEAPKDHGWIVYISEQLLRPPDPSRDPRDPLHDVSWYEKGLLKISTKRKGGITLHLGLIPLIQR